VLFESLTSADIHPSDGPTEAQVRLQLKRDKEKDLAGGRAPLHGTSATAFLTAGLQIEQTQCVINLEQ
jgi:hypothetical protein